MQVEDRVSTQERLFYAAVNLAPSEYHGAQFAEANAIIEHHGILTMNYVLARGNANEQGNFGSIVDLG